MSEKVECRKRSVVKSITFRTMSVVMLTAVTFAATGDLLNTAVITGSFQTMMTMVYYAHERAWATVAPLAKLWN